MKGFDVNFNPAIAGTNHLSGVSKVKNCAVDSIKFNKKNELAGPKNALNPSTLQVLANLNGRITPEMADVLLATPYVGVDFNS